MAIFLDAKHAMAGRRAVATNNRNADSSTLLDEKLFIAARSQAMKTSNVGNTMPTNKASTNNTSTAFEDHLVMHTFPGAVAVEPSVHFDAMAIQQHGSGLLVLSNNNLPTTVDAALPNDEEVGAGEHPVNATLVDETNVVGSATVIDTEAEEKVNQRKRTKAMVGSFCLASIIAAVIAIAVVLTRPSAPPPSLSPTMSAVPSGTPSSIPSASPSTDLFGFLAFNSYDGGFALTTLDSPQYRAWKWLEQQLEYGFGFLSEMNYSLLQTYSLVTMFYATFGSRWDSTVNFAVTRRTNGDTRPDLLAGEWLNLQSDVNARGSCSWRGVFCNQQGEITSLQMSNDRLLGSLPAELAVLKPSLSKCYLICGENNKM
jgi:hypothetical protein